jgi:hypothetical protein
VSHESRKSADVLLPEIFYLSPYINLASLIAFVHAATSPSALAFRARSSAASASACAERAARSTDCGVG